MGLLSVDGGVAVDQSAGAVVGVRRGARSRSSAAGGSCMASRSVTSWRTRPPRSRGAWPARLGGGEFGERNSPGKRPDDWSATDNGGCEVRTLGLVHGASLPGTMDGEHLIARSAR